MALPGSYDLVIYRGDDFDVTIGLCELGGRAVDDLVLTDASAVATSASANFIASDVGKQVATADGTGIADGATILSRQSATQVTLSEVATEGGTFAASIRALDATDYAHDLAEIRATADSGSALATLTAVETRAPVGMFVLSLADTVTDDLPTTGGVWDWQVIDPDGKKKTLAAGDVTVVADVSKP